MTWPKATLLWPGGAGDHVMKAAAAAAKEGNTAVMAAECQLRTTTMCWRPCGTKRQHVEQPQQRNSTVEAHPLHESKPAPADSAHCHVPLADVSLLTW